MDIGFSGDSDKIKKLIGSMFEYLGENPHREGLQETPRRVIKSWDKLYGGYNSNLDDCFKTFKEDNVIPYNQIILLKNIEFYSTCEHHLLPFFGKAHIAYIPNKKVVGISKLARLLEHFSRRLQIQERIGNQVTESLMQRLEAKGAACIIEAQHFCMTSRGVEKQNSIMVTSSLNGCFLDQVSTRQELMTLIHS
ncbi:MAG: GTP cyclohydrolase I FolE [Bdellovibrionales bacterium RIFOXYA1_FULL_36_14]|nr:MAG: GTP cyclohydrolase I FolE [Bdellovibrionales bacterium RIFOXYA1_FULL_36_14]